MSVWRELVETVRPPRDSRDGPLPPLLLVLTVVTGLVDSLSYLRLGHVFVANMTGNVVFLGFALGGAPGLSAAASIVALLAFIAGSLGSARLGARVSNRGLHLRDALMVQFALVAAACAIAAGTGTAGVVGSASRYSLILLLAVGMGIQNATVRRLGVADLTTTVLTMALTGIAADARVVGGRGGGAARRGLSVVAMLLGALAGALLILNVDNAAPLAVAAALIGATAIAAHVVSHVPGAWAQA